MSKPPRFFITPDQVSGSRITVAGDDLRHIRTVLRKGEGDRLVLLDGRGNEYLAAIASSSKDELAAEIIEQRRCEAVRPRVTLGQGIAKSDKMDWIVQKATELGVASIVPLVTERTIVKVKDEEKRVDRWQRIAREAAMQSCRPDIPGIGPIVTFSEYLRRQGADLKVLRLIPWEEGTTPLKTVLRDHAAAADVTVLIGPEGGFSQAEAEAARERGFHPVNLGPTILRTETAAIAALSMIGYELRP